MRTPKLRKVDNTQQKRILSRSNARANFIFADGHAAPMTYYETIEPMCWGICTMYVHLANP